MNEFFQSLVCFCLGKTKPEQTIDEFRAAAAAADMIKYVRCIIIGQKRKVPFFFFLLFYRLYNLSSISVFFFNLKQKNNLELDD